MVHGLSHNLSVNSHKDRVRFGKQFQSVWLFMILKLHVIGAK